MNDYQNEKDYKKVEYALDQENVAKTLQYQAETEQFKQRNLEENQKTKHELALKLDSQLNEKQRISTDLKKYDLELGKQSTGFNFECDLRKEVMRKQAYDTGSQVRTQIDENQRRKRDQRNQEREAPDRLWTYDKLQQVKQQEVVDKFYVKIKNINEFRNEYDKHMSHKQEQARKEKDIDTQIVNDFAQSSYKGVYEKIARDHTQKHTYGKDMRGQLVQNVDKKQQEIAEIKAAPEIISKLNEETRHEQAFSLSKKPVITKYTR